MFLDQLRKVGFNRFGSYDKYALSALYKGETWYFQYEPNQDNLRMETPLNNTESRVLSYEEFCGQLHPLVACSPNFRFVQVRTTEWLIICAEEFYNDLYELYIAKKKLF